QKNYYGTKKVTEALLPLLLSSSDGRIVNVTSGCRLLRFFRSEELKQELDDVDKLIEERLDELLDEFLKHFEAGAVVARGWPADRVLGLQGGQGGRERLLPGPGEAAPGAARQRRGPRLCEDRHDPELGAPRARGRRGPGRGRGAAPGRWRDRCVLWQRQGGVVVRVIGSVRARHGLCSVPAALASRPHMVSRPQQCCVPCSCGSAAGWDWSAGIVVVRNGRK
ncbi:unnamed protein product, partial [Urochloa humidicola]